jgi:hypothetical protein
VAMLMEQCNLEKRFLKRFFVKKLVSQNPQIDNIPTGLPDGLF